MAQNDSGSSHILIGGDFNYPKINWIIWTTSKRVDHRSQLFLDIGRDIYPFKQVSEPTQVRHCQKENLLDLILTSDDQMVLTWTAYEWPFVPMDIHVYT